MNCTAGDHPPHVMKILYELARHDFRTMVMHVLVGLLVGLASTLAVFVVFQTLHTPPPPLTVDEGRASAERRRDIIEVSTTRTITVSRGFAGWIHRQVVHTNTGKNFDSPDVYRVYDPGKYTRDRLILMPGGMPSGEYVMKTTIVWQPAGSLVDHWYDLPDVPFSVSSTKRPCN